MPQSPGATRTNTRKASVPDRRSLADQLRELPLRAAAAFAVRCARRVEPLLRLNQLRADAYSAGLDVNIPAESDWQADTSVTATAIAVNYAAADVAADIAKLRSLNLGKPGEPGAPIRWNDPRLGPLWPDGPPPWYIEAEKACRELEEQLRLLPNPNEPPMSPELFMQLEAFAKLQQLDSDGKLRKYGGEYVISDGDTIFAHGRNLLKVRQQGVKKAQAKGIPPERVADYFVSDSTAM